MEKLKITVCIVVLNEEKTIKKLLSSFANQSLKPDEIIIVDGGSKDNTINIIKDFQKKHSFIKLFVKKLNIPASRNFAVQKAKNDLIAFIDAGCYPKKEWLETLTSLLYKKNSDIAFSLYKTDSKTPFQRAYSFFVALKKECLNPKTLLPSTRSVILKKSLWKDLGGFNEKLFAGEDQEFFLKAKEKGYKFAFTKKELVVWYDFENITPFLAFKKLFNYARGDALSGKIFTPKGILSHNFKALLIFARYTIFIFLFFVKKWLFFIVFLLYLLWAFLKFSKSKIDLKTRLYFPIIQLISDFAVMAGFLAGSLQKLKIKLKK